MKQSLSILALSLGLGVAACSSSPPFESGEVRATDGTPISYDVRGRGRTTLVFVHCWSCNRAFWKEQVDAFADRYRVVSLDLPGHGASGHDRERWHIERYGDDVATVVHHLALHDVVLVGHSMGGPVSLAAAKLLRGRVKAVVAVDTLHDMTAPMPKELVASYAELMRADFPGTMRSAVEMMFGENRGSEVCEWTVQEALKADPRVAVALFYDFPNLDLARLFREAGVPVRAINARSKGAPPTNVAGNKQLGDYDVIFVPGVGHFLQLERPGVVNAALSATLAELGV
jgi:pimeloyl-ACP methyl ester carboxylesterase